MLCIIKLYRSHVLQDHPHALINHVAERHVPRSGHKCSRPQHHEVSSLT